MHQSMKMKPVRHPRWNRAAVLLGIASLLLPALCLAQTPPVYTINTIIGSGPSVAGPGYSGDGGTALTAQLNAPTSVVLDSHGNIYIADQANNVIREVVSGNISTVAGTGTAGYSGDTGLAASATLTAPDSLAFDSQGNYYFSEVRNNVVREVTISTTDIGPVAGKFSLGAGDLGDGFAATAAQLNGPAGIAIDSSGNIYIADSVDNKIRLVTASTGNIGTYAGTGFPGFYGNGGPAISAQLYSPRQIALNPNGNGDLYIADSVSNQIRKISHATGLISLVAGDPGGNFGYRPADDGGPAAGALLNYPTGVAVDASSNVYIADNFNNCIRMVTPDGIIHTIAGTPSPIPGWTGDGGPALSAQFKEPTALSVDGSGNLYVADLGNNVIRKLTPNTGPPAPAPKPVIRTTGNPGVQSASDFGAFPAVAPGSWIEIYGTNLAPVTRSWATTDFNGDNAPTTLGVTTVTIGGQGAFIDYISPTQVNAQVPGTVGLGPQPVTVSTASGTSNTFTVTINYEQPGLLAPTEFHTTQGQQYVIAQLADVATATYAFPTGEFAGVNSRPAAPGELITIYGIGFGPVPGDPPGQIPQSLPPLLDPAPKFYFGSGSGKVQATVQFAGLAAPNIGLYQFNVVVPTNLSCTGTCTVPVTFTVNIDGTDVPGTQTLYTAIQN
jgi:uncharacterized protein (TIGR03437 family)